MSDDRFIMDRVFAGRTRQLVFLLSSNNQPLNKSINFYKKCITMETGLPLSLHHFVEVLCKPFTLPTLDINGNLKSESVIIALSSPIRQNIILFLQAYKKEFDYANWIDFLQRNYAFLDSWSKVILNEEIGNKPTASRSCLLSDKVKEELGVLCKKFKHIKPFVNTEYSRQVSSPPNKRRRLPSLDENFFNDEDDDINEDELVAACDKTQIEFADKSKSSAADTDPKPVRSGEHKPENSSDFMQQNMLQINNFLESELDFENDQLVQLLICCPSLDFPTLLEKLNVSEWNESIVSSFLENFVKNEVLSFEKTRSIIQGAITSKLLKEQTCVPRNLYQTIVLLLTYSKRLGLLGVLCECLAAENYQSCYTDTINKLFTSQILDLNDINILLENCIQRKSLSWNEEFLNVLVYLVDKRSNLKDNVKGLLIGKLVMIAGEFSNSLIMMKLVLSLIQGHQDDCHGKFSHSLRTIVEQNETFLKKKALRLLYVYFRPCVCLLSISHSYMFSSTDQAVISIRIKTFSIIYYQCLSAMHKTCPKLVFKFCPIKLKIFLMIS